MQFYELRTNHNSPPLAYVNGGYLKAINFEDDLFPWEDLIFIRKNITLAEAFRLGLGALEREGVIFLT